MDQEQPRAEVGAPRDNGPVEQPARLEERPGAATATGGATPGWGVVQAAVALTVVVLDQATKAAVRAALPLHSDSTVIPGFLSLTHVRNSGAAFGILNSVQFPGKPTLLALAATAALIGISIYAARLSPHQRVARLGLALILGGAIGNLIDRLAVGYVLDFVDVYWRDLHFWAFNVADSAITVGVGVMILDMMRLGSDASTTA
jgi:signal peptidase II